MKNVTLDWNCVIALEKGEDTAPAIRELIQLHDDGTINLRLLASNASENAKDGIDISNFSHFPRRMVALRLDHLEILKPLGYWDMTYWDECIWDDDSMIDLERRIQGVLFPHIEFDYPEYCRKQGLDPSGQDIDPDWRNKKCDVIGLWCHIHYDGDVFVTTDRDFHQATKIKDLIDLGAGEILKPDKAVEKLKTQGNSGLT